LAKTPKTGKNFTTMKKTIYLLAMLMIVCGAIQAQDYRRSARKGNSLYKEKKYTDAETAYRRSLAQDSTFYKAQYNLGNALYKQKKYDMAKKYYTKATESADISDKEKSAAMHNMGNCAMQEGLAKRGTPDAIKSYQEAVDAYKNSLKASDKNDNTKYNLAMAQQLLRQEQQQQQQNQNQQNQDKQNQQQNKQNKQNQNKDQNKDQQNKQDQNQDQQNKNKDKQKQQQQQNKDQQKKKSDAERMLEALKNKEQKTLDKQKVKIPAGGRVEKDW
jgi:hypothetical protein